MALFNLFQILLFTFTFSFRPSFSWGSATLVALLSALAEQNRFDFFDGD